MIEIKAHLIQNCSFGGQEIHSGNDKTTTLKQEFTVFPVGHGYNYFPLPLTGPDE